MDGITHPTFNLNFNVLPDPDKQREENRQWHINNQQDLTNKINALNNLKNLMEDTKHNAHYWAGKVNWNIK
jgi:hypothetical protein